MRAVIGIALILALLDHLDDPAKARILGVDGNPRRLQPCAQVRLAGLIAHRDDAFVADKRGVDVFVSGRVLQDRAGMQAGLVGKGAGPDIGRRPQGHAVQDVVQHAAGLQKARQSLPRDAGFKTAGIGLLEQKRRDQRRQVRIAAAFPEAVQRALDLPRPGIHRSKRIRDRVAGIVVAMDAKPVTGDACGDHLGHDAAHLGGKRAAVGVAQDDPAGTGRQGCVQAGQRIAGVGAVAVKEMLRVEKRLAAPGDDVADRGGNGLAVVVKADAKGSGHVEIMGLADQTDGGGIGVQDGGQHIVILGRPAHAAGHAKGSERRFCGRGGGEEIAVGRVGTGPAALDMVDPKGIQSRRDLALFGDGKLDALGLLAIAKGGVEKVEALSRGRKIFGRKFFFCSGHLSASSFTGSKP